jgi:hypothetical protein
VLAKKSTKSIPSDYISTVQNLKQNSMVLAKITALSIHDDSPVESKPGEDWISELSKLKKALTAKWRAGFKDLSSESTPAVIGSDGAATQKCWDCDENGHRRGDPCCRQQGSNLCRKHLP